jgi:endonuclease/exonuclease/phosphatase family metal-dependent hydrolase
MTAVRVLTWNLQGSRGVDTDAVAEIIGRTGAEIVALQEVRKAQIGELGSALGMDERWWVFKHWPVVGRPEGLAVLTPHRLVATSSVVLRRAPFWSWRRRVVAEATLSRDGERLAVVNVHLSPHGATERRGREADVVMVRATTNSPTPIICGDLNDSPNGSAYRTFVDAGWSDAWLAARGDDADDAEVAVAGATNWTAGPRVGRRPTQRIDYVFAPPGWIVESCTVAVEPDRFDDVAGLSDHLPVVATLRPPASRSDA